MGLFRKKNKGAVAMLEDNMCILDEAAPFAFVEAYKSLRTNVDYLSQTNEYHTIMVTSSTPGEGKSTVSINLAVSLANSGKSVILVDCDLRKATIGKYMRIKKSAPGITSVIAGDVKLTDAIVSVEELQIDVLPVGLIPANPSEVLGSNGMINLVRALSKAYDYVILDTPPVTLVTDAAIISRYVDGVLLVVRYNITTRQALNICKKKLEDVNAHILGAVLNDYDMKSSSYGKGYYGDYRYGYGDDPYEKKKRRRRK